MLHALSGKFLDSSPGWVRQNHLSLFDLDFTVINFWGTAVSTNASHKTPDARKLLVVTPHLGKTLVLLGGCHFKKEHVLERKTIEEQDYDCYPTTPVLRCLDKCQATKTRMTLFPMTCVKRGSDESDKIFKKIEKRTLDLTGSEVFYEQNLSEDIECDCNSCDLSGL